MGKALGIISLIFGILGLVVGWLLGLFIPFGSYILPGVAIVTGIIGIIVQDSKGMAIAGLILGVIGLVLGWVIIFFLGAFLYILFGMSAFL